MAKLATTTPSGNWNDFGQSDDDFQKLTEISNNIDTDKSLVGAILNFPYADGYAHYRVTKDTPLTVEHIPYLDAWQVQDALIRGLNRQDVITYVKADQNLARILPSRKPIR